MTYEGISRFADLAENVNLAANNHIRKMVEITNSIKVSNDQHFRTLPADEEEVPNFDRELR